MSQEGARSVSRSTRAGAGRTEASEVDSELIPHPEGLQEFSEGHYRLSFARERIDLERVQRLRFEVFNLELGEGLEASWKLGLDQDPYDACCHHMMLTDERTRELVGTYRMQTAETAKSGIGFYCDEEFDLDGIPAPALANSIELGRACTTRDHRKGSALYALWRGLAAYTMWSKKRYLFGCCSLTSQDPRDGVAMHQRLTREGRISDEFRVLPRAGFECVSEETDLPTASVPRLFATYLRNGAKACGPPALDRAFRTIDFLIVMDIERLDERVRGLFFSKGTPADPMD